MSDQDRIARDARHPWIVDLWRALVPLRSVVSFMNSGAHPDDETSSMLAALAFRDGVDISYACSTRGEGGQNDIGTEAGAALGVLRTAEMERACDVLGLRMYWLSQSPDDPITDFGFSKSGTETMGKWGRDRVLARFVQILRTERPDILCPTFLDVPGQHGHHRAMTQAAQDVMSLAADPAYGDGTPWQVRKLYLPAWSGAGQAYDDDLPPPPATLVVSGAGIDPVTGWSWARIGQQSRAAHRTQGMGRWIPAGEAQDWPLHLVQSHVAAPDEALSDGLPRTLGDLGLVEAQRHVEAALAAFPDSPGVLAAASAALGALEGAIAPEWSHKVARKRSQLSQVTRLAARVEIRGRLDRVALAPGARASLTIEQATIEQAPSPETLTVTPVWPEGWRGDGSDVHAGPEISDPYPDTYCPGAPRAPYLSVRLRTHDVESVTHLPLEVPPLVLPGRVATVTPQADVVNLAAPRRSVSVRVIGPETDAPELRLPVGWRAQRTEAGFEMTLPEGVAPGRYALPLTLAGAPAHVVQRITHPHIDPRMLAQPAEVSVQVVDAALPPVRVGYIGGGLDRVDYWLNRMGVDVTAVPDQGLGDATALAAFDTLVIGIFAMRARTALAAALPRIHDWVRAGGTLVTLYHRPWDNWDPDRTPPARLEIGQPSLRWRVTDEAAAVTHLAPAHPILTGPNAIRPADWDGWHKERGLYFAKTWDRAYQPLLEMADPDEAPHHGALLAADIGAGRHVHCALILHHQMERLTPGAFRLMSNLLARR